MKFVVAMDSFKGSLAAPAACAAVARGIRRVRPAAVVTARPMADGGEGTARALCDARGGQWKTATVTGPLPDMTVQAGYAWVPVDRLAVVETAAASGLPLLRPEQRNPLRTSTFGTGELLAAAARLGAGRVLLGLGGSATVDGGTGAAAALGWRFLDVRGRRVTPGGGSLSRIARLVPPAALPGAEIEVLTDVDTPLCGPCGAARVFGPQKGADPGMVEVLEAGLAHLAELVRTQLGLEVDRLSGAGAAGGFGAGAVAFLGGRLTSGIETVLRESRLAEALAGADWVVTGEGRLDDQSLRGKVVSGVARAARVAGARVLVLCGQDASTAAARKALGVEAVRALAGPGASVAEVERHAAAWVETRAAEWAAAL